MTWSKARSTHPSAATSHVITGTAVMLAWFAAAVAATVYWVAHQSTRAGACDSFCVSDRVGAFVVAFFVGIPVGVVGLFAGAVLLALLGRRIRSGWLVGSLAGVGGLVTGLVVVVGGLLVWTRVTEAAGW
ncbi:hypothetical protein [Micromonospora sp. CB01531]|uniref:hypothetical protein n=1 Tax=Micromonospora sp. CB01531 TaxID=1718947 RepID=UPI00093DFBE5|nr:hypothetical protein [Micromonospora sp. CB01531]OKI89150.1 hypothetical protein A6A27_00135 [Micromonospora sp. CB01531]